MVQSPLSLDGWLEFNRIKWGVQPFRFKYSPLGSQLPVVETTFYLDNHGKILTPRLNPYLPLTFEPTTAKGSYKLYRQWLQVAEPLVGEMHKRGLRNSIVFSPEIIDMRPWQWAGFCVGILYTFQIDFPFNLQLIEHAPRKKIKQAQKNGYTCHIASNLADVLACLQETEERQGFKHRLTVADLKNARELLGNESFRAYICYAPNGQPASARIILHSLGSRAVDWVAGTSKDYLQSGATQLLISYALEDLQAAGATGFDFAGASIPNIAAAKMTWGGRLLPHYTVEAYNIRSLAIRLQNWLKFINQDSIYPN